MADATTMTNRALAQIGTRSQLANLNGTEQEAIYANLLYAPTRDFLLREGDYDFSLAYASAVAATAPNPPWLYAYEYPGGALRVRQPVPSVYDPLDPMPVEFNIMVISGERRVLTKTAISTFVFTESKDEDFWDPMFTETFVRFFGSILAFALENRIEASREKLQEALSFAGIANLRDG